MYTATKECRLTLKASHEQGGYFWQHVLVIQWTSCRQHRRPMNTMDQRGLQDLSQYAATWEADFLMVMLPVLHRAKDCETCLY